MGEWYFLNIILRIEFKESYAVFFSGLKNTIIWVCPN